MFTSSSSNSTIPASKALAQIEAKGYAAPYAHDLRKVYRIGCSFSSETGRVADWAVSHYTVTGGVHHHGLYRLPLLRSKHNAASVKSAPSA
jgi:hypothetical protein